MKPKKREIIDSNSENYIKLIEEIKTKYPFIKDIYASYCCGWTIVSDIEDYPEFDSLFEMLAFLEKELILYKTGIKRLEGIAVTVDKINLAGTTPKRLEIFEEINTEQDRQIGKWGIQNHAPVLWCGILGEEVGEVNKAAIESYFDGKDLSEYRKEVVQVAAVCCSMIECLDRNKK